MTILTSRRRFLAGLFCAPVIIPAAKLMAVRAFAPNTALDVFGNQYEAYVSYFRIQAPIPPMEWEYVARIIVDGNRHVIRADPDNVERRSVLIDRV